jgi:hypothetical protein
LEVSSVGTLEATNLKNLMLAVLNDLTFLSKYKKNQVMLDGHGHARTHTHTHTHIMAVILHAFYKKSQ